MSNNQFSSNSNTNTNTNSEASNWNQQHQIEYSNPFTTLKTNHQQQQDHKQSNPFWINSTHLLARHRHHHSLDSSFIPSNQQQQQFLSVIPLNKRSSSLSIDQNHQLNPTDSSSSTSLNYPTDEQSSTSNTIDPNYHQSNKPTVKRSQSKLSLVTAIPASILKKDKPGLLSQEQKRANHIASEQKRRAAIRQGYSRLCLIVPSLRATLGGGAEDQVGGGGQAIQTMIPKRSDDDSPFDEQASILSSTFILNQDESNSSTTSSTAFKRKRNKQLPFESNRPAPRSEAVVLAKTVEYLKELKSERNLFLEKLQRLKMIAISKGIQISSSHRQQHHDHDEKTRPAKGDLDDGTSHHEEESVEKENRLEVWEDKWRGNIHQIDLQLNNLPRHQDLKRDHQDIQILDFNLQSNLHHTSPPTPTTTSTIEFIQNPSYF